MPLRIATVIHLCLAFGALVWILCYPFSGELFHIKSRQILYKQVMGGKNAERFSLLPLEKQEKLSYENTLLNEVGKRPFLSKAADATLFFLFAPSPFERAWVIFSIIIGILLLYEHSGARYAVWLLPLLALCFVIENLGYQETQRGQSLLPSEEYLVKTYIPEPLSDEIATQFQQLKKGWEKYLIAEWAREKIAEDPVRRSLQKDEGEFQFTLAQIEALPPYNKRSLTEIFHKKRSRGILAFYVVWNLLFALIGSFSEKIPLLYSMPRRRQLQ